jgi:nucleoside-diphosphate-sugar epimerase
VNFNGDIIAVTGAGGFVGGACCRELTRLGATVRGLVRRPGEHGELAAFASGGLFEFDLGGKIDPKGLAGGIRAVIHCAYGITGADPQKLEAMNVEGTRRLFDECKKQGVGQVVFISSMAAHAEAKSGYGRGKWLLEQSASEMGAAIIKPGTIIGSGGLFDRARGMLRKLPIVPVPYYFSSTRRLQTVYIDDVVEAVMQSVGRKIGGIFAVAEDRGVRLRDFYAGVAALEGKKRWFVPLPVGAALVGANLAEGVGIHPPITSDNLLGMKYLRHFEVRQSNELLGIQPRGFWQSMGDLAVLEKRPDAVAAIRSLASKSDSLC